MNEIANDIYVVWDDNPDDFQLTFANQLYKNSRLATLKEVQEYGGIFDSFIDSIRTDELVQLEEGIFKTLWETIKDPVGFEEHYLYFIDSDSEKYLIY